MKVRKTSLKLLLSLSALAVILAAPQFSLAAEKAAKKTLAAEKTPGQKLLSDAWTANRDGKVDAATQMLTRLIDEKVCSDNEPQTGVVQCLSLARFLLGEIYKKQEKYQEALPLYEAVAVAPANDDMCGAAAFQRGFVYEKLGQLEKADKLYEDAIACKAANKDWSTMAYVSGSGTRFSYLPPFEGVQVTRMMLANKMNNPKKVVQIGKTVHYFVPRNQLATKAYLEGLDGLGMAEEAATVRKFQGEIVDNIVQWEKVNAPDWQNAKAVDRYKVDRVAMLKNALKASTAFGLKPYEDYLIAQIRDQQKQIDDLAAAKEKQRQEAEQKRMNEENARRLEEEIDREAAENERRKNEEYQKILDVLMKGGKR